MEPVEDDYLSALFTEQAEEDAEERYKLSVAIAEIHYGRVEGQDGFFTGVLYPTVAGKANGDNLALVPWYVDTSMRLTKAIHLRVDGVHADSWSVDELDFARGVDEAGHLAWQGRSPRLWSPPAGATVHCVFKAGVDPLGDYIHGKDGVVGHWECSDGITDTVYCL